LSALGLFAIIQPVRPGSRDELRRNHLVARYSQGRRFFLMVTGGWTFAENGESIAPLCGHSKHLDEGVGNFARER